MPTADPLMEYLMQRSLAQIEVVNHILSSAIVGREAFSSFGTDYRYTVLSNRSQQTTTFFNIQIISTSYRSSKPFQVTEILLRIKQAISQVWNYTTLVGHQKTLSVYPVFVVNKQTLRLSYNITISKTRRPSQRDITDHGSFTTCRSHDRHRRIHYWLRCFDWQG